jgi:hypothetical protein
VGAPRHAIAVTAAVCLLALVGAGACNGTTSSSGTTAGAPESGSNADGVAPPIDAHSIAGAFVEADVGPGSGSVAICGFGSAQPWLTMGTPTAPKPTTVTDGSLQARAMVHVNCTVSPSGDGFDVQASAAIDGPLAATLTVTGHVNQQGGQGLTGVFANTRAGGTFHGNRNCTVTYTSVAGDPAPLKPSVADGYIWGHISCPNATASEQSVANPDGGGPTLRMCDAEADFLFDNCNL